MPSMSDVLRELVSPTMLSTLAQKTGESESDISRGFSAAIPTIASALATRSDDHGFVRDLAALATRTAASDPLAAIGGLGSSTSAIDTRTVTGAWLSSLFGRNLSAVTDSVARYSGLRGSSAASIISVCAPLVLGYIGRLIRSDNLTVPDLADRLRAQPAQLASAVPAGFEMPAFLRAPTIRWRAAAADWTVPALALLSLLCLGGVIWWASQRPVQHARVEVAAPAAKPVGTAGSIVDRLSRSLPGNVNISIPAGSAEDRLSKYLMSGGSGRTMMDFDRISFETGSAKLTTESSEQLHNIATILRAYPNATVTVSGHTDTVGNEQANRNLSMARAKAVANSLTSDGVESNRVKAEGYGSLKPLADNSTEAGRARNRRVTLEVAAR